jgi:spermidine synthase
MNRIPAASDLLNEPSDSPLLYEEAGELSLHFDFPTIQSRMLKAEPEKLMLDYTRTMMGFLLFQPKPQRIAMIGLGGGSLAKYCRRKLPSTDFTAIELSSAVIALRDQFQIPANGPQFRIICADGAEYLRRAATPFDVLLVDGFDAGGQPEQLCSAAFYDNCYAQLAEGGLLVVNLCADDAGYDSYVRRIADSFSEKMVIVEADEGENKIAFASKGGIFPPTFSVLAERLRMLESAHPVGLDQTARRILQYPQTGGQSSSVRSKSKRRRGGS